MIAIVDGIHLIAMQTVNRNLVGDIHGCAWRDVVLGVDHHPVSHDDDLVDMGQVGVVQRLGGVVPMQVAGVGFVGSRLRREVGRCLRGVVVYAERSRIGDHLLGHGPILVIGVEIVDAEITVQFAAPAPIDVNQAVGVVAIEDEGVA